MFDTPQFDTILQSPFDCCLGGTNSVNHIQIISLKDRIRVALRRELFSLMLFPPKVHHNSRVRIWSVRERTN
jgi:hypothetical protein